MASMFTKLNFDQKKAEEIKQVGIIIIRQMAARDGILSGYVS